MAKAALAVVILLSGCLGGEPAAPPEDGEPTPGRPLPPTTFDLDAPLRPGMGVVAHANGFSTVQPPGGICTLNFVFRNASDLFFGTAAHCLAGRLTVGDNVSLGRVGTDFLAQGVVAYSSWEADGPGDRAGQCTTDVTVSLDDSRLCWNDFALIQVLPDDWHLVNPQLRSGRGPIGMTDAAPGDTVHTVGDSHRRGGTDGAADARDGVVIRAGDWGNVGYFAGPSMDGDSGSPVVDLDGRAVGVIVYLHLAPPGANGFASLDALLAAAAEHGFDVELVTA